MKKVTVLGGGTGTFVVLFGLKNTIHDLAVVVNMMDSGGSTGRLRDQLGVLPPGDLRQCLVAMSEASELWRKLFLYRFEKGDLAGHNFGNIFISALQKVCPEYDQVIETASYVLQTKGPVLPITFQDTHVCVEYESGKILVGEGNIDEDNFEESRIKKAYLNPEVEPNQKAIDRIKESDVLIIGPGDLYTSIIPVLLVDNLKEIIENGKMKVIYVMNLMTKAGQTYRYTASDHINDLEKYIGRKPDAVLINNSEINQNILQWYESHNELLVKNDLQENGYTGTIKETDLIDNQSFEKNQSDVLTRSILRHSSEKLTKALEEFVI